MFVKIDMDRYMAELNANAGKRTGGVIQATLRKMQVGEQWIVPPFVSFASVRSTCSMLKKEGALYSCQQRKLDKRVTRIA
jgi:hypothetical protein